MIFTFAITKLLEENGALKVDSELDLSPLLRIGMEKVGRDGFESFKQQMGRALMAAFEFAMTEIENKSLEAQA